ncbi:cellulase-like family protein [Paenibacillus sp.]|uniref:cellulase-like family protein n=1 Tax=Paenibacillus sp. TaxID=58172 RepID=UPI002D614E5D|nr:cellulase-like family protein [Paenibacillus sp.]HZG83712.1 cellulase-like family protein [Paenibacillus sp.]
MTGTREHLPRKLTITMWDFSWYTMTMPDEPYHDLGARFKEAVERGYNTIRVCAMPCFLFPNGGGPRTEPLRFSNLGMVGVRTRWYNCQGGAELDGTAHLLKLFEEAKKHDCYIILTSWEYQQSPSFLKTPELFEELLAVPPEQRFLYVARSMDRLVSFAKDAGYGDRIAYVELHNELEYGRLNQVALDAGVAESNTSGIIRRMKPYVEEAIAYLRERHPDVLATGCYTLNDPYPKAHVPDNEQVAHFHLYINGVLQELMEATGIRNPDVPFPNPLVQSLLREGAPPFAEYDLPEGEEWRLHGNPVGLKLLYLHDWADPVKWDLYLYERYGAHRLAMLQKIDERLDEAAEWAIDRGLPVVIGEGYVGYTPLYAQFEEGPVGKSIAEYAVRKGMKLGFWGMVLCSNCAPHHPFWADVEWQRKWNRYILES